MAAPFVALHHAGDHLADQLVIFVVQSVALGLANLLDHHLLGGLRDAADGLLGIEGNAVVRAADRAVFAVDVDDDVFFFAVLLLGGRDQRRLDGAEDDFLVDVLVAMDRVDDSQQFVGIHSPLRGTPNCRSGRKVLGAKRQAAIQPVSSAPHAPRPSLSKLCTLEFVSDALNQIMPLNYGPVFLTQRAATATLGRNLKNTSSSSSAAASPGALGSQKSFSQRYLAKSVI